MRRILRAAALFVLAASVASDTAHGTPAQTDAPPVLIVSEPLPETVARPNIHLLASCTDDGAAGCVSITATLLPINKPSRVLATGQAQIDATVSLQTEDGNGTTNPSIRFTATDSIGQTTSTTVMVWEEASTQLVETFRAPGAILDDSPTRSLYIDSTWRIGLIDKATGTDTTVFQGVKVGSSTFDRPYGYLTPNGAIFVSGRYDVPQWRVWDFSGGVLTQLGTANPSGQSQPSGRIQFNLKVGGGTAISDR